MSGDQKVHIWHFPERECTVRLPARVLGDIGSMASEAAPLETGGTLVGHYSDDLFTAFVTQALGVKRGARRERARFYRPPDDVDGQLMEIYRKTEGRTYFIGDWHTHPGEGAEPSPTDLGTLRGLAKSRSVATDTPILVIVGGNLDDSAPLSCTLAEPSGRCLHGEYRKLETDNPA